MKRVLTCLIALVLLGAPFSIGAQVSPKVGTLTVWTGFPETESTLKRAAEVFHTQYPNVKVDILTFDFTDLQNKALVSIPAGTAADIIVQEMTDMYGFAKGGLLAKAPKEIEDWIKAPGRYVNTAADVISYSGSVYAMPLQAGGPVLFYNIDFLKEAGLGGPPTTVDELYNDAVKLRKTDGSGSLTRAGISLRLTGPGGGTQKHSFIAYQFSGKQVIEPGKKPGTWYATCDAPGQAEALMWHVNLLNGKDKSDDWMLKHDSEGFGAGDSAMFMRESWVVPYLKENAPALNWGVQVQPRGKYWGVYDYVAGLTIPASGKNKDIAWLFAKATQDPAVVKVLFQESGWIPPRRDANYDDVLKQEPRLKAFIQQPKGLQTYYEASCASSHEIWVSVGEIIQAAYRDASLVNNLKGCQEVLKKAAAKANAILKSHNEYGE